MPFLLPLQLLMLFGIPSVVTDNTSHYCRYFCVVVCLLVSNTHLLRNGKTMHWLDVDCRHEVLFSLVHML